MTRRAPVPTTTNPVDPVDPVDTELGTDPGAAGHNGQVRTRLLTLAGILLTGLLVLTACGGSEDPAAAKKTETPSPPAVPMPTGNVTVPAGVELTGGGTVLEFGEDATIAYDASADRNSVLEVRVKGVREGRIADLSGYNLDDRTKKSTPYYVDVRVKNIGDGDLGNTPIPLLAVSDADTLIQPSTFTNVFKKCPSTPFPDPFPPNKKTQACLMFLIPDGGRLTGVSFRPPEALEPIVWEGTATGTKKGSPKGDAADSAATTTPEPGDQ